MSHERPCEDPFGVDGVADCRIKCTKTEGHHYGTHPEVMINLLTERNWKQLEYVLLRTLRESLQFLRTFQ